VAVFDEALATNLRISPKVLSTGVRANGSFSVKCRS